MHNIAYEKSQKIRAFWHA